MNSCTWIVHIWLDAEEVIGVSKQPFSIKLRKNLKWVEARAKLFKRFTERSLLCQNFKDFRIFLFCGKTHRAFTSQFPFDPKVEVIYDYGRSRYLEEIKTDYVNITRIDSDDMFRFDVMEEVTRKARFTDQRETVIYKDLLQWNLHHHFVSDIKIPRSPFASHTFPRSIYTDWGRLKKEQFMGYRSCPNVLGPGRVCIVRHSRNVTWKRLGWDIKKDWYLEREKAKRNFFTQNQSRMFGVLKSFGVPPEEVFL